MLELLENGDRAGLFSYVALRAGIVVACWLFAVVACLVDFWSGVRTAKLTGELIRSNGFRQTVVKMGDYARILVFALMFDAAGSLLSFYTLPFATMLCMACVLLIEGRSVVENSRRVSAGAGDIPKVAAEIARLLAGKGKDMPEKLARKLEEAERLALEGKEEDDGKGKEGKRKEGK